MEDGTTNGLNGSRWGIRMAEDLGAGWLVGGVLESGFDVSQGTSFQGGRLFGRQAFLLGLEDLRQPSARPSVCALRQPARLRRAIRDRDGTIGQPEHVGEQQRAKCRNDAEPVACRQCSAVHDAELRRLYGALQYAPDENTADDFFGAAVNYNRGPVNVGVSYRWNKQRLSPNDQVNKTLSVGANYDFGFLKLLAAYQQVSDLRVSANGIAGGVAQRLVGEGARTLTIDDQDAWVAGVEVPIGKITRVALLYTTIDYEGVPTTAGQPSSYSLGKTALELKHDLSRRTFLMQRCRRLRGSVRSHHRI